MSRFFSKYQWGFWCGYSNTFDILKIGLEWGGPRTAEFQIVIVGFKFRFEFPACNYHDLKREIREKARGIKIFSNILAVLVAVGYTGPADHDSPQARIDERVAIRDFLKISYDRDIAYAMGRAKFIIREGVNK